MITVPIVVKKTADVIAGKGVFSRSMATKDGIQNSFYTNAEQPFRGAWFVSGGVSDGKIKCWIDRGYVNGLMPVINKTPIAPTDGKAPPALEGEAKFDAEGRAWVGIKITIDPSTGQMQHREQGSLTANDLTMSIESSPVIKSQNGNIHFHPVACILDRGSPIQIAYFDYQWGVAKQGTTWRHYLIPA